MTPKRFLQLGLIPHSVDLALLALRVWMGTSLFLKHGLDKLLSYSEMVTHFPDPLHIGTHATLAIALVSDSICSVLVILGLATRWSALIIIANIFVAWATVVHFQFFGHGVSPGELLLLYIGGFLAIFLAGPGCFSLDSLLNRNPSGRKNRTLTPGAKLAGKGRRPGHQETRFAPSLSATPGKKILIGQFTDNQSVIAIRRIAKKRAQKTLYRH